MTMTVPDPEPTLEVVKARFLNETLKQKLRSSLEYLDLPEVNEALHSAAEVLEEAQQHREAALRWLEEERGSKELRVKVDDAFGFLEDAPRLQELLSDLAHEFRLACCEIA